MSAYLIGGFTFLKDVIVEFDLQSTLDVAYGGCPRCFDNLLPLGGG